MEIKTKYIEAHIIKILNNEIHYLALKRAPYQLFPDIWQPVTGKIKENEKAYNAAKREILEETGIVVNEIFILPKVTSFYLHTEDAVYLSPVFLYIVEPDSKIKLSSEHIEFGWMTINEVKNKYAWYGQRESVDVINQYASNNFEYLEKI
ncbi:MAG: NUDIX domain-containing protein [Bacteroidota bacterium]|nr:NUDIX domain-containing protein [Bacteroidota bacterium]